MRARASELAPTCLPSCRPPLPGRPTNSFAAQPALLLFSPGPVTRTRAAAPRRQWPRTAPPRPRLPRSGRPARWPPSPSGRLGFPRRGARPSEPPVRGPSHGRPRRGRCGGRRGEFGGAPLRCAAPCRFNHSPAALYGFSWAEDFLDLAGWDLCSVPSCGPEKSAPSCLVLLEVVLLLPALPFEQGSVPGLVELTSLDSHSL